MFNNQSEELDNARKLQYPDLYEKWKLEIGEPNKKIQRNHYIDNQFFKYVLLKYKEENKYHTEFAELIDILIRKRMTHRNYINYPNEVKDEMYSKAISEIYKYAIHGKSAYNEEKGNAFTFITTTINNAFGKIIKEYYQTKNIANKILQDNRIDAIAYNYDIKDISHIESDIKNHLDNYTFEEKARIKIEANDFFKMVNEKYDFVHQRLIEVPKVPKFKRKYESYPFCIAIRYEDDNGEITLESTRKHKSKNKIVKNKPVSGIIIEYFDLRLTNEDKGTSPDYIAKRARVARKNGWQYIGVYSDEFEYKVETNEKDEDGNIIYDEIGKRLLMKRINEMVEYVTFKEESPKSFVKLPNNKYDLRVDYIPTEIYLKNYEENLIKPVFYLLKGDRTKRHLCISQDIQDYIKHLDTEVNPTRVYGANLLKL